MASMRPIVHRVAGTTQLSTLAIVTAFYIGVLNIS